MDRGKTSSDRHSFSWPPSRYIWHDYAGRLLAYGEKVEVP